MSVFSIEAGKIPGSQTMALFWSMKSAKEDRLVILLVRCEESHPYSCPTLSLPARVASQCRIIDSARSHGSRSTEIDASEGPSDEANWE